MAFIDTVSAVDGREVIWSLQVTLKTIYPENSRLMCLVWGAVQANMAGLRQQSPKGYPDTIGCPGGSSWELECLGQ